MKKIIRLGAKRCQLVDVTVDDKPAVLVRVLGHSGDRDAVALNTTVKEMVEGNPIDCGYWMFDEATLKRVKLDGEFLFQEMGGLFPPSFLF